MFCASLYVGHACHLPNNIVVEVDCIRLAACVYWIMIKCDTPAGSLLQATLMLPLQSAYSTLTASSCSDSAGS